MDTLNLQMLRAAGNSDLVAVEEMINRGADINFRDQYGNFAMFAAAWEGNLEALDLFYKLGANLVYEEANLLCNAAYNGKVTSVKWLLAKGADARFSFSDTQENALHYTLSKTSEINERTEIVRLLIASGIDVNKRTLAGKPTLCFMRDAYLKGEAPLHRAGAYGSAESIRLLLEAGADVAAKDANGDTPLSWASWHWRDTAVLKLLLYDGVPGIH